MGRNKMLAGSEVRVCYQDPATFDPIKDSPNFNRRPLCKFEKVLRESESSQLTEMIIILRGAEASGIEVEQLHAAFSCTNEQVLYRIN